MPDANSVPEHFVQKYSARTLVTWQQKASKMRMACAIDEEVDGESKTFPRYGKGEAGKKTRAGDVPVMNIDHTNRKAIMEDWYAGEYIGKLDAKKMNNTGEVNRAADAGAYAMGRKVDDTIRDAAMLALPGTQILGDFSTGMTVDLALLGVEKIQESEAPEDGQIYSYVSNRQWSRLMKHEEFSHGDRVNDVPWLENRDHRRWLGCTWIRHNRLYKLGNNVSCLMWHRDAMGYGENSPIETDISWVGQKQEHFAANSMSGGATRIWDEGVVQFDLNDAAPLTL